MRLYIILFKIKKKVYNLVDYKHKIDLIKNKICKKISKLNLICLKKIGKEKTDVFIIVFYRLF